MAVSPVDISMMQRMNDVAQIKHNEITKPDVMQNAITHDMEKQIYANAEQIRKKDDANPSDTRHDAREKGKNSYFGNGGKDKKRQEAEGKVTIKGAGSFDMKI
ncbi:MAG: hypothetical protein PUF12_01445 [Thermoflexaceae bacterium]|nr:hypothetical protein [Thermoflexaceae bacterium]